MFLYRTVVPNTKEKELSRVRIRIRRSCFFRLNITEEFYYKLRRNVFAFLKKLTDKSKSKNKVNQYEKIEVNTNIAKMSNCEVCER